jgi:cystathionine gamma-synthase
LEKWGPGCLFYGNGSSADLDDLENRCKSGEQFLALFCEFPGNPLLKSPDLRRIRRLADQYDFALVVDETIGNFLNVHVLPVADVMVSSLTKIFSGDSNVMGGRLVHKIPTNKRSTHSRSSAVLNPQSRYYELLRRKLEDGYEDNYWPEDAIYLERNSRDFISRNERINTNAEAICNVLKGSTHSKLYLLPLLAGCAHLLVVKDVHYPKFNTCRPFYEEFRQASGGYGGLLSVTFHCTADAITFFDALEFAKGPSLGTNFTLWLVYRAKLSCDVLT